MPTAKLRSAFFFACLFLLSSTVFANAPLWKNGGRSLTVSKVKFGTHDWIFWQGYLLAKDEADLAWLNANVTYAFFGTEAPDLGTLKLSKKLRDQIEYRYKDTSPCHCILYGSNGEVIQSFAADRIDDEFEKAKSALKKKNWKLAAFYVGAMAHYVGDLSQFMHLMGKDSRWNNGQGEDQKVHAKYEQVLEARVDFKDRSLKLFGEYIKPTVTSSETPKQIAYEVAGFTDTGGNSGKSTGEMYEMILGYQIAGNITKPDKWDQSFVEQTGKNVNKAANGVAKLLRMLMTD